MNILKIILILALLGLLISPRLRKAAATVLFGVVLLFYGKAIIAFTLRLFRMLTRTAPGG
jgi:hypothetical protein